MATPPPAGVPVGLATKAGLSGALIAFLSALAAYQDGRTPEAMTALVVAGAALVSVLWGRYQQAVADRRRPGSVVVQPQTWSSGSVSSGTYATGTVTTSVPGEVLLGSMSDIPDEPPDAERFRKGGYPPEPDPDTARLLAEGGTGADCDGEE